MDELRFPGAANGEATADAALEGVLQHYAGERSTNAARTRSVFKGSRLGTGTWKTGNKMNSRFEQPGFGQWTGWCNSTIFSCADHDGTPFRGNALYASCVLKSSAVNTQIENDRNQEGISAVQQLQLFQTFYFLSFSHFSLKIRMQVSLRAHLLGVHSFPMNLIGNVSGTCHGNGGLQLPLRGILDNSKISKSSHV